MVEVDLKSVGHYPPLDGKSASELFDLGVCMARTWKQIRVRAPVGDQPDETVILDGHLLCKKGVAVY